MQRLLYLPILESLFALVITAGICLLVYRFAIPTDNQEPIINLSNQYEVNENVGVVFFDGAESSFANEISSCIKKLDIDGTCEIKYKYNTGKDNYIEAVTSLAEQEMCKTLIITDSKHHDTLMQIAETFKDTNFYVLWGKDEYTSSPLDNVQICRVDTSKAVYSIGVNSAHYLTEKIKSIDVTDPAFSEINHTVMYLYKTDAGYTQYEQFAAGVKTINPNLGMYAVKVDDEVEYAKSLMQSGDVYALMAAEEMPQLTKELTEAMPDNIYLSGVTEDVIKYQKYLCAITVDNSTFVDYIFRSISNGEALTPVYNGTYDDSFCRLEFNKAIIGKLK